MSSLDPAVKEAYPARPMEHDAQFPKEPLKKKMTRTRWLALLLIAVSASSILLTGLKTEVFLGDEIHHYRFAKDTFRLGKRAEYDLFYGPKIPPGYYYATEPLWPLGLAYLWKLTGGISHATAQVYHTFFFLLLMGCTYLLGEKLYGGSVGLWAALLTATMPMAAAFGILFYVDLPAAALSVLFFLLLQQKRHFWSGIALGLLYLMKRSSLFFVPGVFLLLLFDRSMSFLRKVKAGIFCFGTSLLVVAPDILWRQRHFKPILQSAVGGGGGGLPASPAFPSNFHFPLSEFLRDIATSIEKLGRAPIGPSSIGPSLIGPSLIGPSSIGPSLIGPDALGSDPWGTGSLAMISFVSGALRQLATVMDGLALQIISFFKERIHILSSWKFWEVKEYLNSSLLDPKDVLAYFGVAFVILFFLYFMKRRFSRQDLFLWIPIASYMVFYVYLLRLGSDIRYTFPMVPLAALVASKSFEVLKKRWYKYAVCVVCLLQFGSVASYVYKTRQPSAELKEGFAYIEASIPKDAVVMYPEGNLLERSERKVIWGLGGVLNVLWTQREEEMLPLLERNGVDYLIVKKDRIYDETKTGYHHGGYPRSFIKRLPELSFVEPLFDNPEMSIWKVHRKLTS